MKARRILSRLTLTASAFFVPALVVDLNAQSGIFTSEGWFPDAQSAIDRKASNHSVSRSQAAGMIIMERLNDLDRERRQELTWRRYRAEVERPAPIVADYRPTSVVDYSRPYVPPPAPQLSPPTTPSKGGTIKRGNVLVVVPPSQPGEQAVGVKKILP